MAEDNPSLNEQHDNKTQINLNTSKTQTDDTDNDEDQSHIAAELKTETNSSEVDHSEILEKAEPTAPVNDQPSLINRLVKKDFSLSMKHVREQINGIHNDDSGGHDKGAESMKTSRSVGFIERNDIEEHFPNKKSDDDEFENVYFKNSLCLSILNLVETKIVEIADEYDENKPVCRICHGSTEDLQLMCLCRGTMGSVHSACLTRWLTESGRSRCEICNHRYSVRRTLKRPLRETFAGWLVEVVRSNQVFIILSWLMAITPLILLAATLCVFCLRQIFLYSERARIVHPALAFFSFTCSLTLVVWYYDMLFMIARAYFENWNLYYIRDHEIEIVSIHRPMAQGRLL